jgi:arginyl-tRNA synthetase
MNVYNIFRDQIRAELERMAAAGSLPGEVAGARFAVEPPREAGHGDMSTNVAMVLAKPAKMPPKALAEKLVTALRGKAGITGADIAGPGFINVRFRPEYWQSQVAEILRAGPGYAESDLGAGKPVNIEYVSANPTGPMHVGHGRGAVVGDALAALLAKAGHDVTREYYINDAGAQVDILARSAHLRYREAIGEAIGAIPSGLYPGNYLKPVGEALAKRDGAKWRDRPEAEWLPTFREFAVAAMMAEIKEDLAVLGVRHAIFSSELELVGSGAIRDAVADLEAKDLIYVGVLEPPKGMKPDDWEPRPQTLFLSTKFGDDVDRPLKKSDGSWTYFAADIAYHRDKFRRGFPTMVDVWGADHKGYVKRMQAAVTALTGGKGELDVRICNLVNLFEKGEPVKMSKRAGTFVTLREVIDQVGRDAVRFMMLTRGNEATLDFDLAKVLEQSKDNPVFYVQYAHARACSVLRNAAAAFPGLKLDDSSLGTAHLERLTDQGELGLVKLLAGWPRVVEIAAEAHEPHRVAYFLTEVAAAFHGHWNRGNDDTGLRFIVAEDRELTQARVAMVRAIAIVIADGLNVIGVTPVEEMR